MPPAVKPTPEEEVVAEERERRLRPWLVAVTVIALIAAGAAGYAIAEIESTKDENREDDQAVSALRADLDSLRSQFDARIDRAEDRLDDTAGTRQIQALRRELNDLDERVQEVGRGGGGNLRDRVDDLEQRVEDLEQDGN